MNLLNKHREDSSLLPLQPSKLAGTIWEFLVHLQKFEVLSVSSKLFSNFTNNKKLLTSVSDCGIAYHHSTPMEVDELLCVFWISKKRIDFSL